MGLIRSQLELPKLSLLLSELGSYSASKNSVGQLLKIYPLPKDITNTIFGQFMLFHRSYPPLPPSNNVGKANSYHILIKFTKCLEFNIFSGRG